MDKKRIILIIIFILVTIGLGYLLYKVFFAEEKLSLIPKPTGQGQTTGVLPTAGEGQITTGITPGTLPTAETENFNYPVYTETGADNADYRATTLAQASVNNISTGSQGEPRFYNQTDGKFYRADSNGNIVSLSDQVFYNVQNVTWSPTKNESVIEYPDGSNIYYNFETKKQVSLPKHWEQFSFSPQGDKIASKSIGLSPDNRWIISADPQGKEIRLIQALGDNADRVTVDWSPNQQVVAFSKTGEALGANREQILLVGLNQENFKALDVEGRGFQSQWSPTGKKLIYSVYGSRSNYQPELWVVSAEGDTIGSGRKMLNLNTWADKCAMADERFIYCAVPQNMPVGTGFAPALADNLTDKIYKVDIETGLKTELITDQNITIGNMYVGDNGKKLYFTNKTTNGLLNISL